MPSQEEIDYYSRMVKQFNEAQAKGKAAIDFENKMVDIAAYRRAVALLRRAGIVIQWLEYWFNFLNLHYL